MNPTDDIATDLKQRINDAGISILQRNDAQGFPPMDKADKNIVDGFLPIKNGFSDVEPHLLERVEAAAKSDPEAYDNAAGEFILAITLGKKPMPANSTDFLEKLLHEILFGA